MLSPRWVFAVCVLACVLAAPAQARVPVDDSAIQQAIGKAVKFLWSCWKDKEGHWEEIGKAGATEGDGEFVNYGGRSALAAYALLSAGERPQEARMKRALEWLKGIPANGTYAVSLRASVWGSIPRPHPYADVMKRDVQWLVANTQDNGGYGYAGSGYRRGEYDLSNSQMAMLGLWTASLAGGEVPKQYWQKAEAFWRSEQCSDGGWNYARKRMGEAGSYGSMTAAGLASAFICFDALYADQFLDATVEQEYAPVIRGLEWISKNWSLSLPGELGRWDYYYLYSLERVGLASGYKFFGDKDWYSLCARRLLAEQKEDGAWRCGKLRDEETAPGSSKADNSEISTSFCLLFLARGRQPILFNKLRYDGTWNCRPRDLANLCLWISQTFENKVNWQVIDIAADVEDWHDAPILYISGKTAPRFTAEHLAKLRTFVLQGGVIFSEAVLNSDSFTSGMKEVYAQLFPSLELAPLPAEHPVYSLHFPIKQRELLAVSNGCRLLAVHSPKDLSRSYQMRAFDKPAEAFQLASNIYFYVTDRGSLRSRGVSHWPAPSKRQPTRTIRLAWLKHGGNWQVEPLAYQRFAMLMAARNQVRIALSEPMDILNLKYPEYRIAVLSGTGDMALSDTHRYLLKRFVQDGGTLLMDAAGADEQFRASAQELASLAPAGKFELLPPSHPLYNAALTPLMSVKYRRELREMLHGETSPRLRAASIDGRAAIMFNPVDVTCGLLGYPCWGLKGYEPDSAFELMRNMVLYAAGKQDDPPLATQPASRPASQAASPPEGP